VRSSIARVLAPQPRGQTGWSGALAFGEVAVGVRVAGGALAGWPPGARLRIVAIERDRGGPPPPDSAPFLPTPSSERAYELLAAALAVDGVAAILDSDEGHLCRLRSLGGALIAEAGGAGLPGGTSPISNEELGLALALLRTYPRALPPGSPPGAEADGAPAQVIEMSARRRRRAR